MLNTIQFSSAVSPANKDTETLQYRYIVTQAVKLSHIIKSKALKEIVGQAASLCRIYGI